MVCKWDPMKHNGKTCPFHQIISENNKKYIKRMNGKKQEINKDDYLKYSKTHKQENFDNNNFDDDFDDSFETVILKAKKLIKNGDLPEGVKPQEYLGGTMDLNGKIVDMSKFKEGYLVSCGNASYEENENYLLKSDFISNFLEYSDDGELYIGSWYENNKNTNEPTIWIKDKEEAIKLAKLTGQFSITDCKKYNEYGCKNYELLNEEQLNHSEEIFISVCNDEEHKIKLEEVDL